MCEWVNKDFLFLNDSQYFILASFFRGQISRSLVVSDLRSETKGSRVESGC